MKLLRQVTGLLTGAQRRRYLTLLGILLLSGFVQVVGVVSIAPFVALLSRPELIHSNVILQWMYAVSGATSDVGFLTLFAAMLMVMIIVTNAISALSTWRISAVSIRVGSEFQQDIFHGFMRKPFELVARTNSSDLVSIITNETNRFVHMVMLPLLTLISQSIVMMFVALGLLLYDPAVAVGATLIIGGGYFAIFGYLKGRLKRNGDVAWKANSRKVRLLKDSLGGLKEIKIAGLEAQYEEDLDRTSSSGMRANVMVGLLGDLPRFALESLAFCALLALGIILLQSARDPRQIIGLLSLYGMAGYRLMPAAQTIFKSAAQLRANASVMDSITSAIFDGRTVVAPVDAGGSMPSPADHPITFDRVSYRYPGSTDDVVHDLSFVIPARQLTVIVGASGAGKSTVADLLLGLLPPRGGRITVGDLPISEMPERWRKGLGYVAQNIFLLDSSIAANITFGSPPPVDDAKLMEVAEKASVRAFAEAKSEGLNSRVGELGSLLSGGQRQRIGIARALYQNADLLIMDEATSALDASTEREIIETILRLRREKTVVMIAHRASTIQAADHVIVLERGRLVGTGAYDDVSRQSREFQRLLVLSEQEANCGALT
jgi:ABC-type multidrug transport system fused ATPase/permease subunit